MRAWLDLTPAAWFLSAALLAFPQMETQVQGECAEVAAGLHRPGAVVQSSSGRWLVSETVAREPNTGRISIIDVGGAKRTLLDGLPSGIVDVGDPGGPSGLFLRGRTLYVLISVGDVAIAGPFPGTSLPNPNPVSSPLFSSVLAVHFSARVEQESTGATLTLADHEALARGEKLALWDQAGGRISVEQVADFPNYVPYPLPGLPANVQLSNPFDLVAVEDQLYVTDGGRNHLWQVDIPTGAISVLASFPDIPNPLFPAVGGPVSQAVPTGIRYADGRLLVTLFRGVPFAPGTSVVEEIDLATGLHAPLITGLKTAIDVLPIFKGGATEYLVLQHASVGPFFGGPGLLLHFRGESGVPAVLASCLDHPTSMTLDEKTGTIYVTELLTGRLVEVGTFP